jgi:hypothetical protein
MYTTQTEQLDLLPAHHRDDETNLVRAAWPVHRGTGSRSTAAVYFELDRDATARVTGVFSSSTIVSVFDDEWLPYGTRVLGTPPPAEALATI